MHQWSPTDYLRFAEERSRPACDMLNAIRLHEAQQLVDLGCGPGNSTELLVTHYPKASLITGIDSSLEMLTAARRRLPHLQFIQADLVEWNPPQEVDLLFANAVFHWIPNHLEVMIRQLTALKPGAVFAIQMPDNLNEPSHSIMRQMAASDRWKVRFQEPIKREIILSPASYYNRLKPFCRRVDIWHTTYQHVLEGTAAIIDWVKAAGLAPYLERLQMHERNEFLATYESKLEIAYPKLFDRTVMLQFPRLFLVCYRK